MRSTALRRARGAWLRLWARGVALRHGLRADPTAADVGRATPADAPDGSIVTLSFDAGRLCLREPPPSQPILARRYRSCEAFLTLVARLMPALRGRVRLHLHDEHPDAPPGEGIDLVFNRRRGAPAAFVTIPDPHFVERRGYMPLRRRLGRGPPWEARAPRAYWRGSSTGGSLGRDHDPGGNARVRLCRLSKAQPELLDARLGRLVNCDAGHRRALEAEGLVDRFVPPEQQIAHRFLVSIDGWAAEWEGLVWKLASGSTLLMVESDWEQWYTSGLEPFRHFVPVRADLGDLCERIAWCRDHAAESRTIAENAAAFAAEHVTFPASVRVCRAQLTGALA